MLCLCCLNALIVFCQETSRLQRGRFDSHHGAFVFIFFLQKSLKAGTGTTLSRSLQQVEGGKIMYVSMSLCCMLPTILASCVAPFFPRLLSVCGLSVCLVLTILTLTLAFSRDRPRRHHASSVRMPKYWPVVRAAMCSGLYPNLVRVDYGKKKFKVSYLAYCCAACRLLRWVVDGRCRRGRFSKALALWLVVDVGIDLLFDSLASVFFVSSSVGF